MRSLFNNFLKQNKMGNFERVKYPDGQIGARYIGSDPSATFGRDSRISTFTIAERINSYEDLFYIRSIADILAYKGVSGTRGYKLFIPCLFGQRSDRRFGELQSFDLKLITDVINTCGFGTVEILDPHSDVSMALINRSEKRSSFEYVKKTVNDIKERQTLPGGRTGDLILVSPDAGAYKKVFEFGEKLKLEVVGANKHRDGNGNIDLLFTYDVKDKLCLIVDDLCDGGYTFLLLASALRAKGARCVYLYVTHGIFSKGFVTPQLVGIKNVSLSDVLDRIYCTNSYSDITPAGQVSSLDLSFITNSLTQFKVI